jgi:type II secretory pathway predicted ATPase ExeA
MSNALEDPTIGEPCLEFFGLEQLPFAPLPPTKPIFRAEQYALLESHIADMLKDTDCLFMLRGADGAGKTTLLKRYLGGLPNASIALIDESCESGTDFYCSFLHQMGFQDIAGKLRELRTITREFLVHRATASDHVLLVLDNAPRIRPAVLEQLRWISGVRRNKRRVLSVVIAGNSELDRIMESPGMSGLRFQNNVSFTIRAFTNKETAAYIRHRLDIFGCGESLKFTAEACGLVHRYAGGLPQSIDHIGSMLLTEAAARRMRIIDGALVRDIAQAAELPVSVFPQANRGRRKTDTNHEPQSPDADVRSLHDSPSEQPLATNNFARRIKERDEEINRLRKQLDDKEKALRCSAGELAEKNAAIDELRDQLNSLEQGRTQIIDEFSTTLDDEATASFPLDAINYDVEDEIAPIVAFQVIRDGKIERIFKAGPEDTRVLIGRGEDANLRLESDFVSRHHALLHCSPSGYEVQDLNSFNGTIVDGEAVSRCWLKPGQLLVIGNFIIRPVAAKK